MKEIKSIKCKIRGCNKPFAAQKHRLCHAHYKRLTRTGETGNGKLRDYEFKSKDKV